jgi:formylmethanofuran dehydrogenase subunit B
MRVIQITDEDAKQLVDSLKLANFESANLAKGLDCSCERHTNMHRTFHYVVVRWLQKHGATLH